MKHRSGEGFTQDIWIELKYISEVGFNPWRQWIVVEVLLSQIYKSGFKKHNESFNEHTTWEWWEVQAASIIRRETRCEQLAVLYSLLQDKFFSKTEAYIIAMDALPNFNVYTEGSTFCKTKIGLPQHFKGDSFLSILFLDRFVLYLKVPKLVPLFTN